MTDLLFKNIKLLGLLIWRENYASNYYYQLTTQVSLYFAYLFYINIYLFINY